MVAATGVSYRRLEAPGLDDLTGRGVYYGVNATEASQCQDDDVYIVGAANSAGQAALNLSRFAKRVVLLVRSGVARGHHVAVPRRADRGRSPPSRSGSAPRSPARPATATSRALTLLDRDSGRTEEVATSWLFVFIGAAPRTEWLGPDVLRDELGFVLTGPELDRLRRSAAAGRWTDRRSRSRPACPGCSPRATYAWTR